MGPERRFDGDGPGGHVATVNYPAAYPIVNIGGEDQWMVTAGTTFTTTFDSVQRPIKIMDDYVEPREQFKDVIHGPASEITQIKYPQSDQPPSVVIYTETRTYNARLQLTRVTGCQLQHEPIQTGEFHGQPKHDQQGTAHDNCGSNILQLMDCFR